MDEQRKALNNFWNSAADLAESVRRNIVQDGCIDDETVNKLHAYQQAASDISNYMDLLNVDQSIIN